MTKLESLEFEEVGDAVVARLRGEIDLTNALPVRERLLGAVPNTASGLVLDLSDTAYLDSSGVRLIFELAGRLRNRSQTLALVVPEESSVRRVLVLTEVPSAVAMSESVASALELEGELS